MKETTSGRLTTRIERVSHLIQRGESLTSVTGAPDDSEQYLFGLDTPIAERIQRIRKREAKQARKETIERRLSALRIRQTQLAQELESASLIPEEPIVEEPASTFPKVALGSVSEQMREEIATVSSDTVEPEPPVEPATPDYLSFPIPAAVRPQLTVERRYTYINEEIADAYARVVPYRDNQKTLSDKDMAYLFGVPVAFIRTFDPRVLGKSFKDTQTPIELTPYEAVLVACVYKGGRVFFHHKDEMNIGLAKQVDQLIAIHEQDGAQNGRVTTKAPVTTVVSIPEQEEQTGDKFEEAEKLMSALVESLTKVGKKSWAFDQLHRSFRINPDDVENILVRQRIIAPTRWKRVRDGMEGFSVKDVILAVAVLRKGREWPAETIARASHFIDKELEKQEKAKAAPASVPVFNARELGPYILRSDDRPAPSMNEIALWIKDQLEDRKGDPGVALAGRDQETWSFLQNFDKYVLFEDDHVIAVDKPAGINSHHSPQRRVGIEEVARYLRGPRVAVVHRLDRDTTGILVVAKSQDAALSLDRQFDSKSASGMRKIYLAILDGEFKSAKGLEVEAPIVKTDTEKMRVVGPNEPRRIHGNEARSTYSIFKPLAVLKSPTGFHRTLTEVQIITSRTHQIRVVAAEHLEHPVAGDRMYNPYGAMGLPRPMVHAYELTFEHPATGKSVTVTSKVPEDFKKLLATLNWEY